jgi:hypothetical protein
MPLVAEARHLLPYCRQTGNFAGLYTLADDPAQVDPHYRGSDFLFAPSHLLFPEPNAGDLIESQADSVCSADCPPLPLPNVYGVYVFCFKTDDQFVIGAHQMWEIGLSKLVRLEGQTLPIRQDQRHVWAKLPSGWTVRLNQYNNEYPFHNVDCRNAAQLRSFQRGYTRPGPVPGEPTQPVMHGDIVYGWALCSPFLDVHLHPVSGLFNCKVWDLDGRVRQETEFRASPTAQTQWDEAVDGQFHRLHLRDGTTLDAIGLLGGFQSEVTYDRQYGSIALKCPDCRQTRNNHNRPPHTRNSRSPQGRPFVVAVVVTLR